MYWRLRIILGRNALWKQKNIGGNTNIFLFMGCIFRTGPQACTTKDILEKHHINLLSSRNQLICEAIDNRMCTMRRLINNRSIQMTLDSELFGPQGPLRDIDTVTLAAFYL